MYSQITVRGADAVTFLQGQLTQDLHTVSESCSPLAAWCTPKGRVIAVMRLLKIGDGIGLVLPAELADDLVAGLSRYRLRARVEFLAADPGWRACAVANATDIELLKARHLLPASAAAASCATDGVSVVSPNPAQDHIEVYGTAAALQAAGLSFASPLSDTDWRAARIGSGIADLAPATSGKYTPHMLNLDKLGAVSFKKGCYTGQEIVARTQHLGAAKRRAAHFHAAAPVAVGDSVLLDGTTVGEVLSAAGREVLVLLPVALQDVELHAGNIALQPRETVPG
jgi:folate-binding protein YgfZ